MEGFGIGLVGYGYIGRVHTLSYKELPLYYPDSLPKLSLAAVCTSRPETARAAAQEGGYASWFTDVNELVRQDGVTVIDCCTPNFQHRQTLLAAIAARKHIYCEKPLALNGTEAREIARQAQRAGVLVGMTFNYRFIPALIRAKQLISEGSLGEVYSFRAEYFHTGYQDPQRPLGWKMKRELSGGGALVDMGSHLIDLIRHLLGEIESVRAVTKTYITRRPIERGSATLADVTVDDAAWLEVRLAGGSLGTMEISRFATGALDDLNLEIFGSKGALRFSLMDANWLYWFDATRAGGFLGGDLGWTRLETVQHYKGAAVPPARSILGWTRAHAECQYAFLRAVSQGKEPEPGIRDGLRAQLVLDAAYASARSDSWVTVPAE
ncbi:MAG: Gfo/Idh/MocA family oxidoreductase [Spirochaetia bacterium]|jgi:predicted dehydrogenase